jgi:hypothetical protein
MEDLLHLRDHVHFAWTGDDIVVLDVERDLYICLVGATAAIRPAGPRKISIDGDAAASALMEAELVQDAPSSTAPWTAIPPRSALSPLDAPDSWRGLGFLANGLQSSRRFHGRSFAELVATARRLRGDDSLAAMRRLGSLVAAYRSGLPWLPRQGLCLHRSFMLLHYLHARGVRAQWVFGVRTWPFAAHCWVQIDDLVVGDDLHRVLRYTPILVV